MKVSIALCIYNGEDFLSDQLDSFLQQTRMPDELIVCDDCSRDKSIEIMEDFKAKAPFPVKIYVNEENLGSTKNFEKSVSLCTGDIIFLCDQDDVWLPQKVELIAAEFEKSPAVGLVFTNAELVDENLKSYERYLWEATFSAAEQSKFKAGKELETLIWGRTVTGATAAFKSDLRNAFMPIPTSEKFIHDGWIAMVSAILSKIVFLDLPLIKYRQHKKQQIGAIMQLRKLQNPPVVQKGRPDGYSRRQSYNESIKFYSSQRQNLTTLKQSIRVKISDESAAKIKALDDYLAAAIWHYSVRLEMPSDKWRRLQLIGKELFGGNYHKYSRGIRSAALDLLETFD